MVSRVVPLCVSFFLLPVSIPDSQLPYIQDAAVGNGTGIFLFVRTILVTPEISEFESSVVQVIQSLISPLLS